MRFWTVSSVAIVMLAAVTAASKDAHRQVAPARPIYIDANTVLCIAQRGIQPSGKAVAPKGKRPGGVAVYGVSSLGVGVADGDVLTEVLGQPVRSQTQVVAMVIAARSASLSAISATLWRGMRSYTVTVEQPYDMPNCSPDDQSCWRSHCGDEKSQSSGGAQPSPSGSSKKSKARAKG